MPKRKLAVILLLSIGLAGAIDMALIFKLALDHKAFAAPLLSMAAFVPSLVIAGLAWQARLASRCRSRR